MVTILQKPASFGHEPVEQKVDSAIHWSVFLSAAERHKNNDTTDIELAR